MVDIDPDKNVIYINRDLVEYGTLIRTGRYKSSYTA